MPWTASSGLQSATRHSHTSPVDIPAASSVWSPLSATEREIKRLRQRGLDEVGIHEAGVLGIHLRQVTLPNGELRKVLSAQVTPQSAQQVDNIARTVTLLC